MRASTSNGTYKAGASIAVVVDFSEAVSVVTTGGSPTLTLETGTTDRAATCAAVSNSATMTCTYTVQAGDVASDLNYVATSSLALNGGTIRDASGNDAALTLPGLSSGDSLADRAAIVIDTAGPTVTSVASNDADGTYHQGQSIELLVTFSEAVTVVTTGGAPTLTLETGATDRAATCAAVSNSTTMTCTYTVQAGDVASDLNYVSTSSLVLNGATIRDAALNDAALTLPGLGAGGSLATQKAFVIDGVAPTVVRVSASDSNGSYKAGVSLSLTVTFSETVNVVTAGGSPTLTLETGTTDRAATCAAVSNSTTMTCTYTVQAGDVASDLNYVATSSLALNGGTIRDTSGNDATLTLPATNAADSLASQKDIVIDTSAPTISGVGSTANGLHRLGQSLSLTVTFSEAVSVVTTGGSPTLLLETGATDRAATCAAVSNSTTMTCTYTVQAGDSSSDLDYVSNASLALNGGTIRDAALNDATLTLAAPGASGSLANGRDFVIDGVVPTVTEVWSSTADGAYKAGANIVIVVDFSEAVNVVTTGGTPTLTLETGATDRNASCAAATNSLTMTCTYTVQAGDTSSDLNYVATSSLALNGATIRDVNGNDATLSLPGLAAGTSLAGNAAIVIDTTAPNAPSSLALQSPASSPSTDDTPTIRVGGVAAGDIVTIYTSSSCTVGAAQGTENASGTTVDITSAAVALGTHTYYARSVDAAGNASACSTANVAYQYTDVQDFKFEVAIDMIERGGQSTTAWTMPSTRTSLDTADYDGNPTYYYEVVASNISGSSQTVSLVNESDVSVASVTVPSIATHTLQLIRSSAFTPTSGSHNYRVRLGANQRVFAARIIIQQTNPTKTRLYFPLQLGRMGMSLSLGAEYSSDGAGCTYGTTYAGSGCHSSRLTKSGWAGTVEGWSFEGVGGVYDIDGMSDKTRFVLYNETDGVAVAGTETAELNVGMYYFKVDFADNASGFDSGDQFGVRGRLTTNNGQLSSIFRAGLSVKLSNPTQIQSSYRIGASGHYDYPAGGGSHAQGLAFAKLDLSAFTSPSVFFEALMVGSGSVRPYTLGATNTQINNAGTTITDGTLSFGAGVSQQRSSALTVTSGDLLGATPPATAYNLRGAALVVTSTKP